MTSKQNRLPSLGRLVKLAAGNGGSGKEVMALLLDQDGDQIATPEDVVKAAATCGENRVLSLLFQQNGHRPS